MNFNWRKFCFNNFKVSVTKKKKKKKRKEKIRQTKSLVKTLFSRNFRQKSVTVNFPHCGTYEILLPPSQIFRQINVLLKNFNANWFDEKTFAWQRISRFSTLCFRNFHTATSYLKNSVKLKLSVIVNWFDEIFLHGSAKLHWLGFYLIKIQMKGPRIILNWIIRGVHGPRWSV